MTLPWEDEGHRVDEGYRNWLADLWGRDKDRASALSMATSFIRKARSSRTNYDKCCDHWLIYQASRQEQAQKAQQEAVDEASKAERDYWLRQNY